MDEKNGVLELGELEYHKRWYIPNYFRNSVSNPIISKLSANGPFWPLKKYPEKGPVWSGPESCGPSSNFKFKLK